MIANYLRAIRISLKSKDLELKSETINVELAKKAQAGDPWSEAVEDAALYWRTRLTDQENWSEALVSLLQNTKDVNHSAGDFCLRFVQAVVFVIGYSPFLDESQKRIIQELSDVVENRPFPALLWARLIRKHLAELAFLKERLARLSADKRQLLALIGQVTASDGSRIGLRPHARLLIHGYSGVIPSVLQALPRETKETLRIFTPRKVRRRSESEGERLRHDLLQDSKLPQDAVEVVDDDQALQLLQQRGIDTFVMSAKAIGLYENRLCVINTFSAEGFPRAAREADVPVLVISGRYKMWPQDLFGEYAEKVLRSHGEGRFDALILQDVITWFATEAGAFTSQECRELYSPWLTATIDSYPDWTRESHPPVDWFFQDYSEAGLRAQVTWCEEKLGFGDAYFAKVLQIKLHRFADWRFGKDALSIAQEDALRAFWRLHLRLRTFYNADIGSVRRMYEHVLPKTSELLDPLWSGTSIKTYIEERGAPAIRNVQVWIESLRVPKSI